MTRSMNLNALQEEGRFHQCLKQGVPYFGPHLYAFIGSVRRHLYMQALVEGVAQERRGAPLRILEIGSWCGASAITFAAALREMNSGRGCVICVDVWAPYFESHEIADSPQAALVYEELKRVLESGTVFNLFKHNTMSTGNDSLIMPMRGRSDAILPLFADASFDIVYVDGGHNYSAVKSDLHNSVRLVAPGGILMGDDLELQYNQVDPDVNRERCEIDYTLDPATGLHYHPGVTRAVSEVFGRVSCWEGVWAMKKTGEQWSTVPTLYPDKFAVPEHLREVGRS